MASLKTRFVGWGGGVGTKGKGIKEGKGKSHHFGLLKFTPRGVQRHSLKFNTLPLSPLHCEWDHIQNQQNYLTTPSQNSWGGGGEGASNKKQLPQSNFRAYFSDEDILHCLL
jgi:hypothetical protein